MVKKSKIFNKEEWRKIISILKDFKISKDQINITIKRVSKELNKQLADSKYFEQADKIIVQNNFTRYLAWC